MKPLAYGVLLRTQSDDRLVELARQGSEAAFEEIVGRYRAPLERFCRRLLSGAAPDDVVQQTFMSAWAALQRGAEVRNLKAWLYTAAANTTVRAAGAEARGRVQLDEGLQGRPGVDAQVELKMRTRSALAAVAALPPNQREALIGTALEGRSGREVAQRLGLSDGAFRDLVHRARTRVRTASTALVPFPLVISLAAGSRRGDAGAARLAELVAGGAGSGGAAAGALKVGAVVATAGAIAAGPAVVDNAAGGGPQRANAVEQRAPGEAASNDSYRPAPSPMAVAREPSKEIAPTIDGRRRRDGTNRYEDTGDAVPVERTGGGGAGDDPAAAGPPPSQSPPPTGSRDPVAVEPSAPPGDPSAPPGRVEPDPIRSERDPAPQPPPASGGDGLSAVEPRRPPGGDRGHGGDRPAAPAQEHRPAGDPPRAGGEAPAADRPGGRGRVGR